MVSIIISTYKPQYLEAVKQNIAETIGVPFEVIAIENKRLMGICKAYNLGAAKAKFPYLCFAHEDVIFKTQDWAKQLIKQFETDSQTGLIGVAGSKYKCISPTGWYNGIEELDLSNIIQYSKDIKIEQFSRFNRNFEEAVCLDGVFLFTKKNIWNENKFDEKKFKDFHCYDLDFSLKISMEKKVFVTNTVLLEHFSMGSYDKTWVDETIKLHKKWNYLLPKGKIDKQIQKKLEWDNKIDFLYKMIGFNYSFVQLLLVYFNFGLKYFFYTTVSIKVFKLILITSLKNNYTKLVK
ncbi:MAG: glycosyltransferase [Mucilaginibacter sp.]|uniref:glycosyltransferase n=1 Tax=Mucilaginibacter sp. TaxID=1882438 RepID=UPI0034E3D7B1